MSERIWVVQRRVPGGEWEAFNWDQALIPDEANARSEAEGWTKEDEPQQYRAWPYVPAPEGADQ